MSCSTAPKKTSLDYQEGIWSGKAHIKDFKKNKTHVLSVDIVAIKPDRVTMDVTTSLGIHLARLSMNQEEVGYLLTRDKAYFRGAHGPNALRPVLKFAMDPRLISNLLFDTIPEGRSWTCSKKDGLPEQCAKRDGSLTLVWEQRNGGQRKVLARTKRGELTLDLKDFEPKVGEDQKVFQITPPASFRRIVL